MKRILIVDDLEQNRYLLEATLRSYRYEVVSAQDGAAALAAARSQPPDLVISDILMPGMDGFALCRAWRADARLRGIPFIFYTATYTDPKDEQLALDLGADRFVLKPQEPQVLHEIILDVLARGAKTVAPGAAPALPGEIVTLREYNEVLVRKLEKKLTELDATQQQLLEDIRQRKETEEALRQSEERWRLIYETEPECVKLLDASGVVSQMNPAGLRMIEADSLGQVAGHCIYALIVPEHRAKFQELTGRVFQGGSGTVEFQFTGLKGTPLWLETHATPLRDEWGAVISLLGVTRDITERKRAEAALSESEAKYRTLIARMEEGLIQVDDDDIIEFVNPRICQMLGYSEAELLGRHAATLLNREEDCAAMAERNRQRTRGISEGYEIQLRKKSGEFLWVWNSATPVTAADGHCSGSMAIVADIAERKQSEALLQGQKQVLEMIALGAALPETLGALLRFIESQSPEMLCSVLLLDAEGTHLRHGAAPSLPVEYTRAIDGVAIGPCVGSCGTAAFRREAVIVEDIATDPLWADYRGLALAHGLRACWSTPVFDEQRCVLATFAIYYREHGRPTALHRRCIELATGMAAIAISRTRAESALRASEHRLRGILDSMFVFVGLMNLDGKIVEVNHAPLEAAGLKREDVLGKTVAESFWFSHSPALQVQVREALARAARGEVARADYLIRIPGGQHITIDTTFAPLRDASGNVTQIVGSAVEITERKRAEEALRESREQLRALAERLQAVREEEATRIARELHDELGGALTTLKIDVAWMTRHTAAGKGAVIAERAKATMALLDSTIQSVRRICLELRPAVLDQLGLATAVEWLAKDFEQRTGVVCTIERAESVPVEPERAVALFRIMQEVLTNVARHAHAGEVRISLADRGGRLVLEIADDGGGFDESAPAARKGLGLVGMRERAASAGGSLVIESAPGRGTRVRVSVPAGDVHGPGRVSEEER